ncbi:right-handed parallel beta-helix repeat-containing protein [Actinokineospora sp. UTMC 2448]|uniref:right-handed parallel beta-helix repeat-containing protein n=1 Tax=Actinokineospora sp. UTMC 2448 TaxID=2268449 RepID=UPI0021644A96|nr:right-handed parallel beta-helix repeat-containing protein [Actinokineospora sp. UTMC 2448]UVS81857.1 hypothetical protein Actkin_05621 [Actinokineospora sp. UTMC 2448]
MTAVATEADLRAALLDGGDITAAVALDLTAPLEITVPGTRVHGGRYHAESGPVWLGSVPDIELSGMHLHGGRDTTPSHDQAQRLIHIIGSQASPLPGVVVRDCRIRESRGDAVRLEWCVDSQVHGVTARGLLYAGVMVISGERVTVAGCTIVDAPLSPGVVNTYGVAVTDYDNTEQARSRDCAVIGNTVFQVDWEGIDTHGGDGVLVAGNTVQGCPRGVALVVGNATRTTVPTRCTVTGNSITARGMRVAPREGVLLGGLPGKGASATITGNRIDGYQRPYLWGEYIDRAETIVAGNSQPMIPWCRLDMTASDFVLNTTYPLEIMIDGDTGYMRGGVIRKGGAGSGTYVGRLPVHGWPSALTWVSHTKGSSANASNARMTIYPDGRVYLLYPDGADGFTLPGIGTWRTA